MCEHQPPTDRRKERAIRERDHNQCQVCGRRDSEGADLEVHQIVPLDESDSTRLSNYILLCEKHHERAHNRDQANT